MSLASRPLGRRLIAAVATAVLATTGLGVATASPALAAGCSVPSHSANGGGSMLPVRTITVWTGPYSACGVVGHVNTQQILWAWCWVHNSYGNTWWYVRVGGTSTYGWVYDDYTSPQWDFHNTYVNNDYEPIKAC